MNFAIRIKKQICLYGCWRNRVLRKSDGSMGDLDVMLPQSWKLVIKKKKKKKNGGKLNQIVDGGLYFIDYHIKYHVWKRYCACFVITRKNIKRKWVYEERFQFINSILFLILACTCRNNICNSSISQNKGGFWNWIDDDYSIYYWRFITDLLINIEHECIFSWCISTTFWLLYEYITEHQFFLE